MIKYLILLKILLFGFFILLSGGTSIIDYFRPCSYYETCECGSSDPWIKIPQSHNKDAKLLEVKLRKKLYGQPLVITELSHAVANHINTPNPSKALSIALHGLPGTGKSYTAKIVADYIYRRGMASKFASIFLGGIRNCKEGSECLRNHQKDIQNKIIETLKLCKRSLFIIDEVDDMPSDVLNSLMSFLDEQNNVFGVDPRQSIFMFLSNSGSTERS